MKVLRLAMMLLIPAGGALGLYADDRQMILDRSLELWKVPGVSSTVITADGELWTGTAGTRGGGQPVRPGTLFDTGSITKTFTAALVLSLVEEGTLSLEDPVSRWVPAFPGGEQITIRHLLNHTSGLEDTFSHPDFLPMLLGDLERRWTPEDSFRLIGDRRGAPGARFHYANPNYLLLGMILERASGKDVATLLSDRITRPGELHTVRFRPEDGTLPDAAHPFIDVDGDGRHDDLGGQPMTSFITSAWTAGAIVSDSRDLARWGHELFRGRHLGETAHQAMLTTVDRPDGWKYGLGVALRPRAQQWLIGHSGNGAGFSAALWHDPDSGSTVAVLTNAHLFDASEIADLLLDATAGRTVELPEENVTDRRESTPAAGEVASAFHRAGMLDLQAGDPAKAVDSLGRAVELEPGNGAYQRDLGIAALAACNGASMMDAFRLSKIAVAALSKAIELDGNDVEARMALMRFHLHAPPIAGADREEAMAQARAIAEIDPEMGARALSEVEGAGAGGRE